MRMRKTMAFRKMTRTCERSFAALATTNL